MSNVFNNELQQAIKGVYTLLENNELEQQKLTQGAKLGVYFAHGQTEKASNKLATDQTKSSETGTQLEEATDAAEVCKNIVTAATAAATDARNTNSSASTAAVNIQAAANSLSNLAADVAAIYAVATSKDYDSKIQHLANRAYQLTQTAADLAEKTTLQSLNTTVTAAQSRASVAQTQSKTLATGITTLMGALNTNFEALQTKVTDDSAALTTAIANESEQDGIYQTARVEKLAMQSSEEFINKEVNYDLKYTKIGTNGTDFKISFNEFEQKQLMLENGDLVEENVLREYRIIFTAQDDAPTFDIHTAKATEYYFKVPMVSIMPIDPPDYWMNFITAEKAAYEAEQAGVPIEDYVKDKNVAKDHKGNAIVRGEPYVAFVYAVYECDYQAEMDDTDGALSLGSLPFTLKTLLPAAEKPILHFYQHSENDGTKCKTTNAVRVSFKVDNPVFQDVDLTKITDFNVILFQKDGEVASKLNHYKDKQMFILAQLDETYRLTEQAYLNARQAYKTAIATGKGDIDELKDQLALAEQKYTDATQDYNDQLKVVDNLEVANLSKFFIDLDILASIPAAYTLPSEAIDADFIALLKTKLTAYEAEQTALNTLVTTLTGQDNSLSATIKTLQDTNRQILENEITPRQEQLEKDKQAVLDKEKALGLELGILGVLLEGKHDLVNILEIIIDLALVAADTEALNTLFTNIDTLRQEIKAKEDELSENQNQIVEAQRDLVPVKRELKEAQDNLKVATNHVDVLTTEISELETSLDDTTELKDKQDKLADMRAELNELESATPKPAAKTLNKLNKEINELENEIIALQSAPIPTNVVRYVAINEDGDFTDNYGEPMIHGKEYTALVYSVIKPSEPEAIPLFQPNRSRYSDGVVFDLPQL